MKRIAPLPLSLLLSLMIVREACAQNADELAKQLSNPIASLTSVPIQFNYDEGYGTGDDNGHKFLLNVQPVIPVSIGSDWNMISRTILPIISQDDIRADSGSQSGIGVVLQRRCYSRENEKPSPQGGPI